MKKIADIEKITNAFPSWTPSDIAFIKSIHWSTHDLAMVFYFQMRSYANGWPDVSKAFFKVSLTFKNVQQLTLNFQGVGLQQVMGFDILDLSNDQMENINFLVDDYENGVINFYCHEIVVNGEPVEEML